MVNQKGEFPLDAKVSARVKGSTKRLLKKLKKRGHHESDVIEYAARQLSNEPLLLEWEIDELELQMISLEKELVELRALHKAKLLRLKEVAPKRLDKETLNNLMLDNAKEFVEDIIKRNERLGNDLNIDDLCNPKTLSHIRKYAEDLNYDPDEFSKEVFNQLRIRLSDNNV